MEDLADTRQQDELGVGSEWKEKEEEAKDGALKDTNESNTRTNSHITKIV